jgi:hypothetical protein
VLEVSGRSQTRKASRRSTAPRVRPAIEGPKVAKGRKFPIAVSVACWVDLLGYGAMIAEARFNPLHHRSNEAFQRLHNFHSAVAASGHRYFSTLVMNDGAVAYRDLSMRSRLAEIPSHDPAHNPPGQNQLGSVNDRAIARPAHRLVIHADTRAHLSSPARSDVRISWKI